ncbi:metalloprotease PmbA [Psychrobium sp. 1_MG-2023]|nr:metalloprotease PmbA [Psychrobium sp. 1_MG-2023]MDP2560709.1 metalloprotease PmbA [Psychrobium sp. 1_MG-2023]
MAVDNDIFDELARVKESVAKALDSAKRHGASSAEVSMSKQTGLCVSTRLREVETVEFNHDGALGISVYCGNRKGSSSTSDLSESAIESAVKAAISIAKHTSEDPYNGLADADLMVTNPPDLDLYHPGSLDPQFAIEQALAAEDAALSYSEEITNSDGASYNSHQGLRVYGNSHGLLEGYPSTRHSLSCVTIGERNGEMERDYDYAVSRYPNKLGSPKLIGEKAAQHTIDRLGARKLETMTVPVVIDASLSAGFIGHLVSAIGGGSLYRKASFLLDRKGEQIFPSWLSIEEKPHLKGYLASTPFDHEGLATKDLTVIDNGVLASYLITSYAGRKLNMQPTGHAGGTHTWLVNNTVAEQSELLKQMGTGLLVTDLMGSSVNIITGDYSRGAAGFWVENGVIQYPVHEITIAGNLNDMYKNIVAISGDVDERKSTLCGSILLEEMKVAGN